MTKKENIIAKYLKFHNCSEIFFYNFCLMYFDKLKPIWTNESKFKDHTLFKNTYDVAHKDILSNFFDFGYIQIDKMDCT